MDFLLVTVASILFPYIFNLSGINYMAHLGINASLQEMNKYNIELIDKNGDYKISSLSLINYTGYGLKPDIFVDYSLLKGRFWISPSFGFEPLTNGIQYRVQLKTGGSTTTNSVLYNKGPYFGLKLGLCLFKSNPELKGYGSFGFTPYMLFGIMPVSYESEAYYQSSQEKRYYFYWGIGSKIDIKGPWSIYLQYKHINFDTNGSGLNQQIDVTDNSYQFGLAYWLMSSNVKAKLNKVYNYDKVLEIINNGDNGDTFDLGTTTPENKTHTIYGNSNNEEQVKAIYNTNQQLKKDSKLVDKAKTKKTREIFSYEDASNIDF